MHSQRNEHFIARKFLLLTMLIVFGYVVMGHTLDIVSESEEIIEDESTMEEIEYETLVAMENENQIVNWANEDKCDIDSYQDVINENNMYLQEKQNEIEQVGQGMAQAELELARLSDVDYLRQNYFQCDSTTSVDSSELNADNLLGMDMSVAQSGGEPTILIYHTHSQEGYVDSVAGDSATTVVGVGEYLATLLRDNYGYNVIHHEGEYDKGDRDHAYSNSLPYIEQIVKDNPSIQLVIDLHRDGVNSNTRLVTKIGDTQMAQIMFFCGLSRTTALGNIDRLPNPYIQNNLALAFQMQVQANQKYPGLARRIYLKGYRYNMHICPKCMLVEVGAQTNTLQEAKNAMVPLADVINQVISKK